MSCKTPSNGFSHLDVKSTIEASKCRLKRGESARHRVEVTNYALLEVQVEIECLCPPDVGLEHACGRPWKPESRSLSASLRRPDSTTFDQDLRARADACVPGAQRLQLTVRRRPLRAKKWAASKTIPLKDLEIL